MKLNISRLKTCNKSLRKSEEIFEKIKAEARHQIAWELLTWKRKLPDIKANLRKSGNCEENTEDISCRQTEYKFTKFSHCGQMHHLLQPIISFEYKKHKMQIHLLDVAIVLFYTRLSSKDEDQSSTWESKCWWYQ